MNDKGVVNIHGKLYKTVAKRVDEFREEHKSEMGIITSIVSIDEKTVVMRAEILDKDGRIIATGHAEEMRSNNPKMINSTSALENCETSAIGRALSCLGYGGGEFASADEVANAIKQQEIMQKGQKQPSDGTRLEFDAVREHLDMLDDLESVDAYSEELRKKHPTMTKKQFDAISKMFNARREELKQNESD